MFLGKKDIESSQDSGTVLERYGSGLHHGNFLELVEWLPDRGEIREIFTDEPDLFCARVSGYHHTKVPLILTLTVVFGWNR